MSHDGGKAAGDHCYTLTVTDRCSGWTTIVRVPSRAQMFVFEALTRGLMHLPFPVRLLHSDNGSEFINDELRRFCDVQGIRFTPEVRDQAKARLLRQLGDIDPLALQRDISILQQRLLGTNSQDLSPKAVTEQTISL